MSRNATNLPPLPEITGGEAENVGFLGGSFNPVHTGHVRLALEVLERAALARVEVLPAHVPPHKTGEACLDFATRLKLTELAFAGADGVAVNPVEAEREGPSYTFDTLTILRRRNPKLHPHFILGAADVPTLPAWHRGLELPALTSLVCVPRKGEDLAVVEAFVAAYWPQAERSTPPEIPPHPDAPDPVAAWRFPSGARLLYLPAPRLDISSSGVRESFLAGRSLTLSVPEAVRTEMEARRVELTAVFAPLRP